MRTYLKTSGFVNMEYVHSLCGCGHLHFRKEPVKAPDPMGINFQQAS